LNYVDIVIGGLLVLAFSKGFLAGAWRSILNLIGTIAGVVGAYFLTGPVVRYLEATHHIVAIFANWWEDVFLLLPVYGQPYEPASLSEYLNSLDSVPWLHPFRRIIQDYFLEIQGLVGPQATWGEMLSLFLSKILISGVVFLILLAVLRLIWSLLTGGISTIGPVSFSQRFLGGMIQMAVSFFWLSILVGSLYPIIGTQPFEGLRDAVSSSWLVAVLLGVYRAILPAILTRLGFPN